MPNKRQIINAINAIAKSIGRPPTRAEFISRSGISLHFVLRSFPAWSEAIRAAGLRPYALNVKIADRALLKDWGKVVRRNRSILRNRGRLPRHIYRHQGKYNPHTLAKRFGGWSSVPRAFRTFAKGKREWADVLALLPACVARSTAPMDSRSRLDEGTASFITPKPFQHAPLKDRAAYGNPTNFLGLRHEPVNEQGVVLLFGMLAEKLGYMVETVQNGFPDCEAKRRIGPERWQRVQVEFEYESKNFRQHGHPLTGCDVIVCWRHNWEECPKNIEVVELSEVIRSLASAEQGLVVIDSARKRVDPRESPHP